jgi:uncharacterized membrane protein YphA (DoxX/SURF4 family)
MQAGNYFSPYSISLHMMNGSYWFQALLGMAAYAFALLMLFGYRTRLFTFLSFVLLYSIQIRNPLVLQGGDDFLRLLLFWAIFLPTGKIWSVDSLGERKPASFQYYNWANVGYILLLFSVYFFTSLMKHSNEWYIDGTALYYAFSIDQMAYPLSKLLYPYPKLLQFLTFGTIYLELFAPLLLLIPYKPRFFKSVFVIGLTLLHIGIGLTMQVGYFFIISIVAMVGIWPMTFVRPFERLANRLAHSNAVKILAWIKNSRPTDTIKLSRFNRSVIVSAIALSLVWNIGNISFMPQYIKKTVIPVAKATGLTQNWGMFAPTVYKADGWYVYEALTTEGDTIDILKPSADMTYEKPKWPVYQYPNAKWRKLGENLIQTKNKEFRTPFCRYLLTRHNALYPDQQIWKLNVVYFMEESLPNYEVGEIERGDICSCFLKGKKQLAKTE